MAAVHLCDTHYVTDAAKYISVLLLSLRAIPHLELPNINVLFKVDPLTQYGDLGNAFIPAPLSYYALTPRDAALNMSICELIEDFGLVGVETLAVEVRVWAQVLDSGL